MLDRSVDWDFPNSATKDTLHSIHPYPAKFIPEIPRALIQVFSPPKDSVIFDPFCGSGVTLSVASQMGYESLGVDLNPIACLISKVKLSTLGIDFVDRAEKVVADSSGVQGHIPDIPNLDHWFANDVQTEIASILSGIEREFLSGPDSDAALLALSSILVRVSRQDSDTRYAAVDKSVTAADVPRLFVQAARKISEALSGSVATALSNATVVESDILELHESPIDKKLGLLVTSPPYPNAYEYWLYHKYRMFWLGYDPIAVKRAEIGARAHYFKKNRPTEQDFLNQLKHVLSLFHGASIDSAYACFVIGRSKIHGEIIDNAQIVSDAGSAVGFETVDVLDRTISRSRKSFNLSHAKIGKESIVVLRKEC